MLNIANYIVEKLLNNGIKTKLTVSNTTNSIYIISRNLPTIRISDHTSFTKEKQYHYNLILNGKTNIFIKGNLPVFYYSDSDVDKLIRSYTVLYKKRGLN